MQQPKLLPLVLAISLACASVTPAATITVTTSGDSGSSVTCTLRQAIESANADTHGSSACTDGSGADTITFAADLADSHITLTGGALLVTAPLTISGSGQIIDANNVSVALAVESTTLDFSNMSAVNGSPGFTADNSEVTARNVMISSSSSNTGGGARLTAGTATLISSTVSNNLATVSGGGITAQNGAVVNLVGSTISGNSAGLGGGIYVAPSTTLTVSNSTISGNSASGTGQSGAGINGQNCSGIVITDSTISGNTALHQGGGMLVYNCNVSIANSTVTGNSSTVSGGGGIYVVGAAIGTLINTTVSGNSAAQAGGILVYQATVTMANTIASNNTVHTNYESTRDLAAYSGAVVSANYSLLGTALNTPTFNAVSNHNVFSDSPVLGSLQNNGGPTQTLALLSSSPAIATGSPSLAKVGTQVLNYDQRGQPRRFGGSVDIGAFESEGDRVFAGGFEGPP
jgi:hypothetical protein